LLACGQPCRDLLDQPPGKDLIMAGLLKLQPQVNQFDFRQRTVRDPLLQFDKRVLPFGRVVE